MLIKERRKEKREVLVFRFHYAKINRQERYFGKSLKLKTLLNLITVKKKF